MSRLPTRPTDQPLVGPPSRREEDANKRLARIEHHTQPTHQHQRHQQPPHQHQPRQSAQQQRPAQPSPQKQRGGSGSGSGSGGGRSTRDMSSWLGGLSGFFGRETRARDTKPIIDWRAIPDWKATYAHLYAGHAAGSEEEYDEAMPDALRDASPSAASLTMTSKARPSPSTQQDEEEMDDDLRAALALSLDESECVQPMPSRRSKEESKEAPAAGAAAVSSSSSALAAPTPTLTAEEQADQNAFYSQPFVDQCMQYYQSSRGFPVDASLNSKIKLYQGDITRLKIDAVVNAANSGLWGGGGICGAIFSAAGDWKLAKACKYIVRETGDCPTGETRLTRGFDLPASFIMHTVGPMDGDHDDLYSAYRSALDMAVNPQLIEPGKSKPDLVSIRSLALCCISTGIFGFENEEAAMIALRATREWLSESPQRAAMIDGIVFCVFLPKDKLIYERLLPIFFPVAPPRPVELRSRAAYPPLMNNQSGRRTLAAARRSALRAKKLPKRSASSSKHAETGTTIGGVIEVASPTPAAATSSVVTAMASPPSAAAAEQSSIGAPALPTDSPVLKKRKSEEEPAATTTTAPTTMMTTARHSQALPTTTESWGGTAAVGEAKRQKMHEPSRKEQW